MDMFSLRLRLNAISSKTPEAVAEALDRYVYLPLILRSDNGLEFTDELTRGEPNRLIGIEQTLSSLYRPQSLGLLEEILQAYVDEFSKNWALRIPIARWAWTTTRRESLGDMFHAR